MAYDPPMPSKVWYTQHGQAVGYLGDDGKWLYKQSGEIIGYLHDGWLRAEDGSTIGWVDHDGWIYAESGEPLGYIA
jgi:hypothetical protein